MVRRGRGLEKLKQRIRLREKKERMKEIVR